MENITLYYREGSSDKVYQASIQPQGYGFVVHFAYGRRGSTLTTGVKTPMPVDHPQAKAIYDKLVREKTAKGYTPGETGVPYQHTSQEGRATGILPQLLNPVDSDEAESLLSDPQWLMQEKYDGRRLLIHKTPTATEGINRSGLTVDLPMPVMQAAEALSDCYLMDGECIGDQFVAFDLLQVGDMDLRPEPYSTRLSFLMRLVPKSSSNLAVAPTAATRASKVSLLQKLKAGDKEGAVFRHAAAPHQPGRPARGGTALKLKFYETASFIVGGVNSRRSVSLMLLNNEHPVPAGNVTIAPNHEVPKTGEIVEVRYLYAFPESGHVYQPVYLGRREDILRQACNTTQLKLKPAA